VERGTLRGGAVWTVWRGRNPRLRCGEKKGTDPPQDESGRRK